MPNLLHLSDADLLQLIARSDEVREDLQRGWQSQHSKAAPPSIEIAHEVARRVAATAAKRQSLDRPVAVARLVTLKYWQFDQEVMGACFLDVRQRLIVDRELFRGTLRRCSVEPRPILRIALEVGAAGVVVFHTHPSGDPSPSAEDLAFTERLRRATDTIGVDLLDHVICGGPDRFTSLRRTGALT